MHGQILRKSRSGDSRGVRGGFSTPTHTRQRGGDNGFRSGVSLRCGHGVLIAKLLASDGAERDWFGWSIAIDNGVVAVVAFGDDDNGSSSGSAYLFEAITGVQIVKLLPADGADSDRFGYSLAIGNGAVAVGAYLDDDNGSQSGSAYLFDAGCSPCDPCDMNCDGLVDANDIQFFIDILFNGAAPCGTCTGDVTGDGMIDAGDMAGFIACLFP